MFVMFIFMYYLSNLKIQVNFINGYNIVISKKKKKKKSHSGATTLKHEKI